MTWQRFASRVGVERPTATFLSMRSPKFKEYQTMTQELSQDLLHELFDYKDSQLFWKQAKRGRNLSKPAGSICNGYVRIRINEKQYLAHRLVFLMHHGHLPQEIDHIDGNQSNNAIENLRPATHSQNLCNRGKQKNNTSGFKGVSWHKNKGRWIGRIRINGKLNHLGYFDTAEQAHEAYCQAAKQHHNEFANLG